MRYGPETIYALYDAAGAPRYVGRTTQALNVRLWGHWTRARRGGPEGVCRWLRLQPKGSVSVRALEVGPEDARLAEHIWIALHRKLGHSLVNDRVGVPDEFLDELLCRFGQQNAHTCYWCYGRFHNEAMLRGSAWRGRKWAAYALIDKDERQRRAKANKAEASQRAWAKRRALYGGSGYRSREAA